MKTEKQIRERMEILGKTADVEEYGFDWGWYNALLWVVSEND